MLNKRSICFILVLTVFYVGIGLGNSLFTFRGDNSFSKYSEVAKDVTGPRNDEFAKTAKEAIDKISSVIGDSRQVMRTCSKNNVEKLYYEYNKFSSRVDAYYNGVVDNEPTGIIPLQNKLTELESQNKTDTYQFKKLKKQLNTLTKLGAPEFENVILWESLYEGLNGILLIILLFFPLVFLISSVYTKEVSTGMDNILLSSVKGRTSMVFAKLGAVSVTCIIFCFIYFTASFLGNFLPYGMNFTGATASVRCLSFMSNSPLNMSIQSFVLLTFTWVTLTSLVVGIITSLISSLLKNHATVFGCSIIVLLLSILFEALGSEIVTRVQLILDFCFTNTISVSTIFGSFACYPILRAVCPYWLCVLIVFLLICSLVFVALLYQQKHRTIA